MDPMRSSFTAQLPGYSVELDDTSVTRATLRSKIELYMELQQREASISVEIRSGLISFLTMSYVMLVNPHVMSPEACQGIVSECLPRDDVVVATALSSAVGTIIAALGGNLPFVLAPGIGLSTYYAAGLVLNGMTKEAALATVALSGVLTVVLSLTRFTNWTMKCMPDAIKTSTVVGMGLLIAFVGLQSVGLVVADDTNLVKLGDIGRAPVILTMCGVGLLTVLTHFDVKGGILLTIVAITLVSWASKVSPWPDSIMKLPKMDSVPSGVLREGFAQLDQASVMPVLTFTLVSLLDMAGVIYGLGKMASLLDADTNEIRGGIWGFVASGIGSVLAGLLGSTPVIIGIESAAGIAEGGRTGITAVTVSVLFAVSTFFAPLLGAIPPQATAPVLIMIGAMMVACDMLVEI